jgi:transcriptional regulator with XRE-family HTH domain
MRDKSILRKFGNRLRHLRKLQKFSQEKLAEKAGLSTTFIGYLERAEKEPTLSSLEKIARALNVSLSELLALPDEKAILDADVQVLNKAIEILKQALEQAKGYKEIG